MKTPDYWIRGELYAKIYRQTDTIDRFIAAVIAELGEPWESEARAAWVALDKYEDSREG